MSSPKLTEDALRIWRAGVDAVAADRLVSDALRLTDGGVAVETSRGDAAEAPLAADGRLIVVGGGKAGVGMALGVEAAIAAGSLDPERVSGLVSAPADCVPPPNERRGRRVRIAPGRPAGVNEPRPEGVAAAETMLRLLADARPQDVALVLLSGGGSALLPAPREGVSLGAKRELARTLSAAGATIEELNTVRQHLSRIKGGGLARACRAGRLITLVISDVLGDPLDLIASGPTVTPRSTPADALAVLGRLGLRGDARLDEVVTALERTGDGPPVPPSAEVTHLILANNATAVDAAGAEAERLGYRHAMHCATASEGAAEAIGRDLAAMALRMRDADSPDEPDCLITGGEPTVRLAPAEQRGRGGRNQQLVLAASERLGDCRGVAIVSGGTDGEDGPTDAAGGWIDESVAGRLTPASVAEALRRNDAYPLLESADGLLRTGPTHTNVCDLRVVTVAQR